MSVTETLARFVAGTRAEEVSPEARLQARRAILDTLGVILAGCGEDAGRIVAGWVREQGGVAEASVLGHGFHAPAAEAALVNGTSGHVLDYDDVNIDLRGHPSIPLLPAVLALGEKLGGGGRDLITSFILGFEIEARLGRIIGGPHYALGWHATSTLGSLGAAAACARLLDLDPERTRTALGIAASLASGVQQNFGSMTKPLHTGWAAHNGVVAATLAERSFTADARALEGPSGFLRAASGGASVDAAAPLSGLGDPWEIVSPGIGVKLYPCCYATHRALDAALELRRSKSIDPARMEAVAVRVSRGTLLPLRREAPKTGLEGKFSLEYCLATAFLDGRVGLDSFTDEAVRRPQAVKMMGRVRIVEDKEPASFPIGGFADVHVRLKDGGEHGLRVDTPRGDPQRPLAWDELAAKFRDCAGAVLSPDASKRAIVMVEGLEEVGDVRELTAVLSAEQVRRL